MGDDRVRDAVAAERSQRMIEQRRPLVIAHRGASGYLTEHSLAAKKLAHDQGADYLEQDVVATRDGVTIICHDLYLERLTNVADVFPGRHRDDGHYYVIDFEWAEIRGLERLSIPARVASADAAASAANPELPNDARLHTLIEELEFIAEINAGSTHPAGVYTEIKHPAWHLEHGIDLTRAVVQELESAGFREPDGSAYIQCFDAQELRRIKERLGCRVPLVQLAGRSVDRHMLTPAGLATIAEYAAVLAPNHALLFEDEAVDRPALSALTRKAQEAGLALHPYTFNYETLPVYASDLTAFLRIVYRLVQPEAVFCDYPDVAVSARTHEARAGE